MMRQRRKVVEQVIEASRRLDVFAKLEDDYKESSSTRGTASIVVFLIIGVLVLLELKLYLFDREVRYTYDIDMDHSSKLKLNVDITVAMPCRLLGADVVDSTSRDILTEQTISMQDTWFAMSPNQQHHHEIVSQLYQRIRSNSHALHSMLWFQSLSDQMPARESTPERDQDACRIHGTFELNKIAGNLHIIIGKSVSFFGNHAHMVNMFDANAKANFSHRIDHFSFGDNPDLVHNVLNYDLKLAQSEKSSYSYFVSVVPTEIIASSKTQAYQYSVTEKDREIDHDHDSHGTPGIFFKYDIAPIKVQVALVRKPFFAGLVVPLIGIVGGIFATSAMLNALVQVFVDANKALRTSK